jgi:hypothetical protein
MTLRASRTDALLVLIAAVLVAIWFLVPRGAAEDPLAIADWSDLAEISASELIVQRGNARADFRIERESPTGQRYVVKGRPLAAADPAALDRLIHALGHLQALRVVDASRTQYGLDHPSIAIELDAHGEKRSILLGAAAPSPSGARYAEIVRDKRRHLVVLAATSAQALDVEPEALLEHRVLTWLPSELQRIESSDALGPLTLERSNGGRWLVVHSFRARARRSSMEKLLLAWTELSANRLLEPAIASVALQRGPVSQFSLTAKSETRQEVVRIRLGGQCPGTEGSLVLSVDGSRTLAGCVDADTLPKLTLDRDALVDDAAFSFHADEVERLEVTGPLPAWRLARKDAAFQLTTSTESPISLGAGNALLNALVKLRGRPSGACTFLPAPHSMRLSLRSFVVGDGEQRMDRVDVEPIVKDGGTRLCRDDGIELMIAAEDAQLLDIDPTLLRDPELLDLPFDSISEVRLETPTGRQLLRRNQQGSLVLVEPKAQRADADAAVIETLRERLANLRAERWLVRSAQHSTKTYVRNAWVDFVVSNGGDAGKPAEPTRHRLELAVDESTPTLGWFDADPAPFQLEDALAELLDGLLLDRSLLRLSDVDRTVTLSRGPDQIQLRRRGNRWDFSDRKPSRLEPTAIVAALENLHAMAVYATLPRSATHPTSVADIPALRIAYAAEELPNERPRLRFEIGARFKRRGQWVRYASVAEPRLTLLLRDDDTKALLMAFQALP